MAIGEHVVRCLDGKARPFPLGMYEDLREAFSQPEPERRAGWRSLTFGNGAMVLTPERRRAAFDPLRTPYEVLRPARLPLPPFLDETAPSTAPRPGAVVFWDPSVATIPQHLDTGRLIRWPGFKVADGSMVIRSLLVSLNILDGIKLVAVAPGHWWIRRWGPPAKLPPATAGGIRVYLPQGPSLKRQCAKGWESFTPGERRVIRVVTRGYLHHDFYRWAAHRKITWHMRFRMIKDHFVECYRFTEAEERHYVDHHKRVGRATYDSEYTVDGEGDNPFVGTIGANGRDIAANVHRLAKPKPAPDIEAEAANDLAAIMGWSEAEREAWG